jgi:phenylpropionate dioxygenase-like ring-hydroxylating dioxygenase large terminal subunit
MLTHAENQYITQTDRGTPMGELFRRFWLPVLLADELPSPDCPPVRVRLLGEDLVAFKDTYGRVGLIDSKCPHRLADMFYGRNEECGLRCVYHGWKFDIEGNCVDMPNEPAESNFKHKVHTTAYPAREWGGVIWAYLGPRGVMPDLPQLEWARVPADHRYVAKVQVDANYLQAMEGDIDSSHVSFLHSALSPVNPQLGRPKPIAQQLQQKYGFKDAAPKFTVKETEYGLLIGARRDAREDTYYWRMTQWLLPAYSLIAAEAGTSLLCNARIPIDDEHSWFFRIRWNPDRPLPPEEVQSYKSDGVLFPELIPGTFRPKANKDNDYLIDRSNQKFFTYTGIKGIAEQDMAMIESMGGQGGIADRTKEHLGTSDTAIIRARRALLLAARDLEAGKEPCAAHHGDFYRVRPVATELRRSVPFDKGAEVWLNAQV